MYLLQVSHLLGGYMIPVIFPTLVEPFLVPLPEVVVYSLIKRGQIDVISKAKPEKPPRNSKTAIKKRFAG
jgi:hypothetical protein